MINGIGVGCDLSPPVIKIILTTRALTNIGKVREKS